jgi:hypothetical protein
MTRLFVPTGSGRQRYNVLGALDVVGMKLATVTNLTYINSQSVCELLDKLAAQATRPITLVMDNARYQRCALVMDHARQLNIELLFLPSYSPNFNDFRAAIDRCLGQVFEESANELCFLLSTNFQSFKNLQLFDR